MNILCIKTCTWHVHVLECTLHFSVNYNYNILSLHAFIMNIYTWQFNSIIIHRLYNFYNIYCRTLVLSLTQFAMQMKHQCLLCLPRVFVHAISPLSSALFSLLVTWRRPLHCIMCHTLDWRSWLAVDIE